MISRRLVAATGVLFFVTSLQATIPYSTRADGDADSKENVFLVNVFDCYMPVPDHFILNTKDPSGFVLFSGSDGDATRIIISAYKADLGGSLSKLAERTAGALTVQEFESAVPRVVRITRIHDGKQQLKIYGSTDDLVNKLLDGCETRKHSRPFSK